ncbi:MAG: (2Fe-2S) ferredoxin domain-containing protein [Cyanobacteria bacterium P01_C01_bin.69]
MSKISTSSFGWVGQFSGFVAGEKSPYQYLAIHVVTTDGAQANLSESNDSQQLVKLSSSLRRMMMGYLHPHEWIRVIGRVKVDAKTGDLQWKAHEIVKLSTQQTLQHTKTQKNRQTKDTRKTGEPVTRVLICQKSGCRQKGSQAVADAIAHTLTTHTKSELVQLIPTGCMKQCKSGPHVVLLPNKRSQKASSHSTTQAQLKTKYSSVTRTDAQHIAHQLIEFTTGLAE